MPTTSVTSTSQLVADGIKGYSKALIALAYSIIAALLLVLPTDGGFSDLTTVQWLGVAALVLGPGGVLGAANAVKSVEVKIPDPDVKP